MFFVVLCTIFLFFFVSARHERFFLWVHQLSLGISPLAARKNVRDLSGGCSGYRLGFIRGPLGISLGIYPVAAREIAWDFSRWPLRRSPSIFGVALGVSEHVPRHFPFKIPGDLDIRSKAMERHVR